MSNIVESNIVSTTIVTYTIAEGFCSARTYMIDETEVVTENILWNIENLTKTFLTYFK